MADDQDGPASWAQLLFGGGIVAGAVGLLVLAQTPVDSPHHPLGWIGRRAARNPVSLPDGTFLAEIPKGTLYLQSSMLGSYTKIEATNIKITTGRHAQYDCAVHVRFVPKGKRSLRGFVQDYHPTLVVLEGWGHFDPDDAFVRTSETSSITRHSSFSEEWETEFDAKLARYLASSKAVVLADFRGHKSSGRY